MDFTPGVTVHAGKDEQGSWGGGNLIQEGKDFRGEEVRVALACRSRWLTGNGKE